MKSWAAMSREERIDAVGPMLAAEMSMRQIAEDLKAVSKNAIIGFVHRYMNDAPRLSRAEAYARMRGARHKAPRASPPKPQPATISEPKAPQSASPKRRLMPEAFKPAPPPLVVIEPIPFINRRMGAECAWIIDDPMATEAHGIRCCGSPAVDGLEWCRAHRTRVIVRT